MQLIAILSTTILPLDGTYEIRTIENIDITGIYHYINHPDTKEIIESFGAIQAPTKLFTGLQVGESAVSYSIKQGLSTRMTLGYTVHQDVTQDMLHIRLITRLS
jgi:hypothetical protein